MAATAKNFDATKTIWNHADVWAKCGIPAVGAKPTLASDGTPDSVSNPNAKHLGYLRGATKVSVKSAVKAATDAQHTAPHRRKRMEESIRVEGRWLQLLDTDIIDIVVDGATVSTVTGGKLVEGGGKRSVDTTCVYIIAERADAAGKYLCWIVLDAVFTEGLEMTFDAENETDSPLGIEGNAIASRADGKNLYMYYIDDSA